MAVFAHPDDETFICGGTLARLSNMGWRVVLACATKGEAGRRMGVPIEANRETLPALRDVELKKACDALGVSELIFLGYRDKTLEIQDFNQLSSEVEAILGREQPDLVVTFHEQLGGHPDHCTIGRAATVAYNAYAKRASGEIGLWFVGWSHMSSVAQRYGFTGDAFFSVDVKSVKAEKLQAFRAHKTQSGLNQSIWTNDKQAMQRLSGDEYFFRAKGNVHPFR